MGAAAGVKANAKQQQQQEESTEVDAQQRIGAVSSTDGPSLRSRLKLAQKEKRQAAKKKGKRPKEDSGQGSFVANLAKKLGMIKRRTSVVVVGLDNSGKTTLLNYLKPGPRGNGKGLMEVAPTIGFSTEDFVQQNLHFHAFDMSGQSKYRSLWETYYKDAQAIIWVIDATDRFRMCEVRDELMTMLEHEDMKGKGASILFFANKMDLPTAMSPTDCVDQLGLEDIDDREWYISACNAFTGEGVETGIDWLVSVLLKKEEN